MKTQTALSIKVELTILKPVAQVFAAVLDPAPFFIEKASEPMAEGKTVQWKFPELPAAFPIQVKKVVKDQQIVFEWDSGSGGARNKVEVQFSKPQDNNPAAELDGPATTVSISESGWPDDENGRAASYRNHMGWTHMVCSLKAYLEYGANLRKGAFAHMKF